MVNNVKLYEHTFRSTGVKLLSIWRAGPAVVIYTLKLKERFSLSGWKFLEEEHPSRESTAGGLFDWPLFCGEWRLCKPMRV